MPVHCPCFSSSIPYRSSTPAKDRTDDDVDRNAGIQPLTLSAGLEPYTAPLDERAARHVLRRLAFGAAPTRVAELVGQPADTLIDAFIDEAVATPLPVLPAWASEPEPPNWWADPVTQQQYTDQTFARLNAHRTDWLARMRTHGLREKMTLFWHDHFVTNQQTYFHAPIAAHYLAMLRRHALGNFKAFVHAVGLDVAMLHYLNGVDNRNGAPNENYARELLELFTTGIVDRYGQPNYTEADIQEIARALTGWQVRHDTWQSFFASHRFDDGEKTIFGHTDAFDYDGVIDLIFEERAEQIAYFICSKLYSEFVYIAPDEQIVDELAQIFIAGGFEMAPVLRTLLKSAHFFDPQVRGARIKNPAEFMVGFMLEADVEPHAGRDEIAFIAVAYVLEQALFEPPSVNGWPLHRNWISTQTLPDRWSMVEWMTWGGDQAPAFPFIPLAEHLHDPQDPHAIFRLPVALAEHFLPIDLDALDLEDISANFGGDLVNHPIPDFVRDGPVYTRNLAKLFLYGVPWYEWDLYNEDMHWMPRLFLAELARLPEFQLT